MSDIIQIAKDRRVRLTAEIGKLEEFIGMAEALLMSHAKESDDAPKSEAADAERADATDEDQPAAEPKADDKKAAATKVDDEVLNLLSKDSTQAPKRQGLFRQAMA